MSEQTKFEKEFIKQVIDYCVKFGSTPHLICKSFGYNNSVKINDFVNGNGAISSRTMGQMIEHMNNNPKTGKEWLKKQNCVINKQRISKFQERFDEMKLKRTMPFKNE